MTDKPDFQISAQTTALIERLRECSIGETITYASLSDSIGEDVQRKRHYLTSALKSLLDDGVIFGTVTGKGIKRLEAAELPAIGDKSILHIRRTARRTRKRLAIASRMNDVPNDVRIAINAKSAVLGVIEHVSTRKAVEVAIEKVKEGDVTVPPMKVIEALLPKK